jgi:hypothetical protein
MTAPFLKKKEGSMSMPSDHIRMGGSEDEQDYEYEMLDAVAEDMMIAFERKDKRMLKAALQSLCDCIAEQDEEQDAKTMGDK